MIRISIQTPCQIVNKCQMRLFLYTSTIIGLEKSELFLFIIISTKKKLNSDLPEVDSTCWIANQVTYTLIIIYIYI